MDRPPDDSASRFLSLATHELRGPLGTVRTYAALLASPRFALDERVRTAVEVMLRNVDRALASWDFLAEAWRLDVGGLRLDLREEDLLPILRASADSVASTARERSVRRERLGPAVAKTIRDGVEELGRRIGGRSRAGGWRGRRLRHRCCGGKGGHQGQYGNQAGGGAHRSLSSVG